MRLHLAVLFRRASPAPVESTCCGVLASMPACRDPETRSMRPARIGRVGFAWSTGASDRRWSVARCSRCWGRTARARARWRGCREASSGPTRGGCASTRGAACERDRADALSKGNQQKVERRRRSGSWRGRWAVPAGDRDRLQSAAPARDAAAVVDQRGPIYRAGRLDHREVKGSGAAPLRSRVASHR